MSRCACAPQPKADGGQPPSVARPGSLWQAALAAGLPPGGGRRQWTGRDQRTQAWSNWPGTGRSGPWLQGTTGPSSTFFFCSVRTWGRGELQIPKGVGEWIPGERAIFKPVVRPWTDWMDGMGWDGSNDWGRRKRVQIALDENDDDTALLALAEGQARRDGKARYGTFTPSCTMGGKCVPRVIIRSSRAVWKGVQQGQHAFTMESTRDGLAAPPSAPLPKSHPGISKCWRRKPCQPGTRVGQRVGARAQEPSAGLLGSNGGAIAATIWKQTPMGQVRAVRDGGAGGAGGGGVTAPRRTLHVMVRERSVSVAVMPLLRLQKAHGAKGGLAGGRTDERAVTIQATPEPRSRTYALLQQQ